MIQLLCMLALAAGQQPTNRVAVPQELNVWVSRNVAPSSKIRLNINTRNIRVVHVTSFPIDGVKWFSKRQDFQPRPSAVGPANAQYDFTIAQRGQVVNRVDNYFSRQVNLPPTKPGVYLLMFAGGQKQTWSVVNVTHLSVLVKRSPYRSLVWVTDYKSGMPVQKAKVDYYDYQGIPLVTGTTDLEGISKITMPHGLRRLVIHTTRDIAVMESEVADPDGKLHCLFQTDRPIYRPGQTVSFKAILRLTGGQGYGHLANQQVNVQLRDPRDNPLDQVNLFSNRMGTVASSFKLPQEGMLGPYSLVLTAGEQRAYQTFTVAAYRKP